MSDNLLRPISLGWKLIFLFKLRLKAGMVHSQYILSMFMSMFFLLARLQSYYSQHFCNSRALLVTVPWKLAKMCMPHYPFRCTLPSLLLLFLSFHSGFSLPDWHGTLFSPGCQCLVQTFGSESLSPRRFSLSSSLPSLHSLQAIISSLCVQARLSSLCECCLVCVCVACASSESQWWRGGCVSEPTWNGQHLKLHSFPPCPYIHLCFTFTVCLHNFMYYNFLLWIYSVHTCPSITPRAGQLTEN